MANEKSVLRRTWNKLLDYLLATDPVQLMPDQERAINMGRIYEQLSEILCQMDMETGSWNWLIDVYADGDRLFAIVTRDGLLYRIGIQVQGDTLTLDDEWTRVTEEFPTVVETRSTIIRSQKDGRYRWFSVSASSVLNRVAEIDSRDLFDSFVAHAEETGEYPIRQIVHLGERLRTGQADWLARDGNLYLTSGLYDDTPLAQLEIRARLNNPDAWGDSIGYWPTQEPDLVEVARGVKVPVYRAGINKEISTLLEVDAANLFTVGRIQEVNRMAISSKQMETLIALHRDAGSEDPEADVQAMLAELGIEERNRAIEEDGLITRSANMTEEADDANEEDGAQPGTGEQEANEAEPPAFELDDEAVRAIVRVMLTTDAFQAMDEVVRAQNETVNNLDETVGTLSEQVAALAAENENLQERLGQLVGRVKLLERDEAEKQAEWQQDLPASGATRVTYRPRYRDAADEGEDEAVDMGAIAAETHRKQGTPVY